MHNNLEEIKEKSTFKKILQGLSGVAIGAAFLFVTLRNKPLDEIFQSLSQAKLFWMLMNAVLLLSIFAVRALRWKLLLDNTEYYPNYKNVFYSLIMGYFVNSFTPKLGEIVRCSNLTKSEKIPFSKSFGTVITERIYDLLILAIGLLAILFIESRRLSNIIIEIKNSIFTLIDNIWSIYGLLFILALIIIIITSVYILKKIHIYERIKQFILDIIQTIKSTVKTKKYIQFLILTAAIWILLIWMNYCSLLALKETEGFSIYFAMVVLFVGGIGWALPSPGGIGTSHFFILQLFILFGLDQEAGVSYGILSNGLTFIFTILIGIITFLIHKLIVAKKEKTATL